MKVGGGQGLKDSLVSWGGQWGAMGRLSAELGQGTGQHFRLPQKWAGSTQPSSDRQRNMRFTGPEDCPKVTGLHQGHTRG